MVTGKGGQQKFKQMRTEVRDELQNEALKAGYSNIDKYMKEIIDGHVNPIKILVKKILDTDSNLIMNEACKAIRNMAVTKGVRK